MSGSASLFSEPRREVAPGAVHLPQWLDGSAQRRIVAAFTQWSRAPVPMRAPLVRGGNAMSVQIVCLGWHWRPYRYTRVADDVNGAPVAPLPDWLADLGRRAVTAAYGEGAGDRYEPDAALLNYYDEHARMGMHQDRDETADEPVVSFSVGDSCRFRFGNVETRARPYTDVTLASGDAFVFGGPSRLAYHGVVKVLPGTADPTCGLVHARINVTLRVTGLR